MSTTVVEEADLLLLAADSKGPVVTFFKFLNERCFRRRGAGESEYNKDPLRLTSPAPPGPLVFELLRFPESSSSEAGRGDLTLPSGVNVEPSREGF
jgi:hypothetical protein